MKREYQKPTMMAVQLRDCTKLLSGTRTEVHSFSNSGLNYSGSDADYEEDAR